VEVRRGARLSEPHRPQVMRGYSKGQKNDFRAAEAIAEAVQYRALDGACGRGGRSPAPSRT